MENLILNCRCTCVNCQRLDRAEECVCCQEIDCVVGKNLEAVKLEGLAEPPSCISQHPGFHAVCVNRWVLQTAWYQYKQQYRNSYEGPEHKKNRHIAYRQLARWCWGILGKEVELFCPPVQYPVSVPSSLPRDTKMISFSKDFTTPMNKDVFNLQESPISIA